jgi:hypothetical protein
MMPSNFASRVNHVQPNSAVSSSNTSQPTRELEQRTNYLREVIEAIEAGRLLVLRDQSLAPDVAEGDAVYWDDENKQFARAIASVSNDPLNGSFITNITSECVGLCMVKDNPIGGTIALMGMLKISPSVLANLIDGPIRSGRLYLSGASPGKLVNQRPAVSVPVGYLLGTPNACELESWLFINPQTRDFLEDHIHYQFELAAYPAGVHTPPSPGNPHVITFPNVNIKGWLPASHASFNGTAPAGAVFGYNLAAHPELDQIWPPIPVGAAILEMLQADAGEQAEFQGLERVSKDFVKIDMHGIWWLSNCYNQVPWETTLDTTSSESVSLGCPVNPATQLILSLLKMTFANNKTVVTSLQPDVDQPLSFVNCDGQDATTGDLKARINLEAVSDPQLIRGGIVMKDVVSGRLRFKRGWVTEGLIAGSDEVLLSGTHQELLLPDEDPGEGNPVVHQGIVTLNIQLSPVERELNPQIVKLGDVLEREYKNVTYLGFPSGRDSNVNMRFNIPPSGLPGSPQLKIRAAIFGRAVGPFSAMTLSYHRIPRPTTGVPSTIPLSSTSVTFDVVTPSDNFDGAGTNLPVDRVIEVESSAFNILPGDTVFVTVGRLASASPLFQADIGVLRIGGVIIAGA